MTRATTRRHAVVQPECLEDLRHWVDTNRKTALRLVDLMQAVLRAPT
jgi:toxin YoeB